MKGHIYFVKIQDKLTKVELPYIKIGKAKVLQDRIKGLNDWPVIVPIQNVYHRAFEVDNYDAVEAELHKLLKTFSVANEYHSANVEELALALLLSKFNAVEVDQSILKEINEKTGTTGNCGGCGNTDLMTKEEYLDTCYMNGQFSDEFKILRKELEAIGCRFEPTSKNSYINVKHADSRQFQLISIHKSGYVDLNIDRLDEDTLKSILPSTWQYIDKWSTDTRGKYAAGLAESRTDTLVGPLTNAQEVIRVAKKMLELTKK